MKKTSLFHRRRISWHAAACIAWAALALVTYAMFLAGVTLQVKDLQKTRVGVFGIIDENGMQISRVLLASPAHWAGLRAGDRIETVNGNPVNPQNPISSVIDTQLNQNILGVRDASGSLRFVPVKLYNETHILFGLPMGYFAWVSGTLDVVFLSVFMLMGGWIIWGSRSIATNNRPGRIFSILVAFGMIVIPIRIPPEFPVLGSQVFGRNSIVDWFILLGFLFIPLILSLFPNGKFQPRWLRLYLLFCIGYTLYFAYARLYFSEFNYQQFIPLEIIVLGIGIAAQFYRYKRISTHTERQQSKWALFGILVGFFGHYLLQLSFYLSLPMHLLPWVARHQALSQLYLLFDHMFYLPLLIIPITLAISIQRYRLWDIDFIIRRTLLYSLLTILLAGIYFGTIIVLENALRLITGHDSVLAIVISTLAITGLFAPLRLILQKFIDRRFYRQKYNADQALEALSAHLRHEVDMDHLVGETLRMVENTVQPQFASLWLRSLKK
jgi:hypothetical protein